MMNYLISYDISEDKVRLKIAQQLLKAGCRRLQKSVFIAMDFSTKEIKALKVLVVALVSLTSSDTNSIICLPISKTARISMWWQPPEENPAAPLAWSEWI